MREHGTKTTPVFLPADGKPLGRYFQVRSPYYQAAQWNQKTPSQVGSEKAKKG